MRKRLPAMLITFLGGVVVHLYLTYLNNGFDPGKVSEWTPYINVSENPGSSAFLIWTAVSSLGWSFLFTIFKEGPVRAATSIAMQPVNLVKKLFKSSVLEYACWAVGGGGALLAAATLGSNRPAGISMGLVWVFMGMSRAGQMLAQFIFQGLMHVLSGHLGRLRPSAELIQIVLAGLGPGFMIAGLLNSGDWQALVGLVVLAGGIGLFFAGRKRQGGMAAAAGQLSALLLIAGGAVAVYTLIRMLWPRSVLANDFGEAENGSFWNAVKNGGDAIVTAAKKAVETALGATGGALAPPIKPPQVYGGSTDPGTGETTPQRTNPWDPDPEEQKNRWKKDHVIWDPQTLEYRPPLPDEYPPPDGPPEYHKKTPYETDHPRDQVPPDCLDLYDKYVKAQGTAQNGASDLKSAAEAYQKAQAVYNLKLQMWTLIMGAQMGEIAAGGVAGVRGAGVAAESAGAAGTSAVRQASREGLREIADSAAVEAAAAETEVNNLTAQVTQLRQLSLDATTEASAAGQALETLKASGVAEEQGAADSASTEVQAAEKAEAESEGELDISRKGAANARKDAEAARNRFERVKEAAARNKEFDALQNEKDSIAERYQELDLEQREVEKQADALRDKRVVPIQRQLKEAADAAADKEAADLWMQQNDVKNQIRELEGQQKQLGAEAVPKAQAELAQLDDQIAAIDAQQKQIISRVSPKKTFKAGDLSGADLQEYQQLSQKMDELKSQRLRVGNDPTAASEVSDKASGLQAQIDAAKEQQAKIEARAKEIDSQDYRK
ncbi:MAG TPA: hypothetical protein VJ723_01545, partial [Candidatus Angelobacter sp.]|nr:hypothetical protein [Candidatus Angelobacter sp.]